MQFWVLFVFVGILQVLFILVLEFNSLCGEIRRGESVRLHGTDARTATKTTKTGLRPAFEVCILSARRPGNATYLEGALRAIEKEGRGIDLDMWGDVSVMDVDGIYADDEKFRRYKFISEIHKRRIRAGCTDDGKDVAPGSAGQLPCRVWQINLDVLVTLGICHKVARRAGKDWILFVEDDVTACENSLGEIQKKLRETNRVGLRKDACVVLRFSKMYMAYAMHTNCVRVITEEISRRAREMPHDLVMDELKDRNITVKVHERNLFHHEGVVSTIAYRNEENYREKYSVLRSDYCGQPL
jgi:predicted transport protein